MSIVEQIIELLHASKKISTHLMFLNVAIFINSKVMCRCFALYNLSSCPPDAQKKIKNEKNIKINGKYWSSYVQWKNL